MKNKLLPKVNEFSVYEGGELSEISANSLLNNEVAIKQLINNYNVNQKKLKDAEDKNVSLISSLEYINTTPFIAITSMLLNISGTIIVGIFITESKICYALWAELLF